MTQVFVFLALMIVFFCFVLGLIGLCYFFVALFFAVQAVPNIEKILEEIRDLLLKGEKAMPIFVCEKCGNIDNSATGHYWGKERFKFKDAPDCDGKALCCECVPEFFDDGSKTGYNGKWHNKFPKEKYDSVKHKDWEFMNNPEGFKK